MCFFYKDAYCGLFCICVCIYVCMLLLLFCTLSSLFDPFFVLPCNDGRTVRSPSVCLCLSRCGPEFKSNQVLVSNSCLTKLSFQCVFTFSLTNRFLDSYSQSFPVRFTYRVALYNILRLLTVRHIIIIIIIIIISL